jgi:hypothetical protein
VFRLALVPLRARAGAASRVPIRRVLLARWMQPEILAPLDSSFHHWSQPTPAPVPVAPRDTALLDPSRVAPIHGQIQSDGGARAVLGGLGSAIRAAFAIRG